MDEREHQNKGLDKKVIGFDRSESEPESSDPPVEARQAEGTEAAALAERASRLQAEKDELMQTLVRRQADFETYRKRVERERPEDRRHGIRRPIADLLAVIDGFH